MSQPEKGMSSEDAFFKKVAGHVNEDDYAKIINGSVNSAGHTRKKDVFDLNGQSHSVKSGKKWQMFLYAKSRLEKDNMMRAIGRVADLLIACIDSLPSTRDEREKTPMRFKIALQNPMRELAREFQQTKILKGFLEKAFFEGSEIDFLAILPSDINQVDASIGEKNFHVFDAKQVVEVMSDGMVVCNSKARNRNQMDAQKVVFRNTIKDDKNNDKEIQLGEIELRTDQHNWGRMKMWLDSKKMLPFLMERIPDTSNPIHCITVHGKAIKKIRL